MRHWAPTIAKLRRVRWATWAIAIIYLFSGGVAYAGTLTQRDLYSLQIHYFDLQDNACATSSSGETVPATLDSTATPEAKIAQTFIVGFDAGTDKKIIEDLFTKYKLGGMYLTGTTDAAAAGFTKTFYDKLSKDAGVLITASSDEEGVVHRYSYSPGVLKPAAQMGAAAQSTGAQIGQGMQANGLNTDLAPVLDLRDVGDGLTGRSFSSDPATVITQAGAFTTGLEASNITPVFKHFPGFDSTTSGTTDDVNGKPSIIHMKGSIDQTVKPYTALTKKFPDAAVMMSNMYVDTLDASKPASTSPKVVNYLRTTVGFKGAITSDDLAAGAATHASGGTLPGTVADSLNAGVTMPLFQAQNTGSVAQAEQSMQSIIDKVKSTVDATKIDAADNSVANFKGGTSARTGASSSCCNGGTPLSGNTNKAKIFNYLTGTKGMSAAQAAGILGNMQTESGFMPERLQGTGINVITPADQWQDINGGGWGLVQWTPGSKMIDPTKAAHRDPNDLETQVEFLWGQLYGKNGDLGASLPETHAGDDLKKQLTPEDAANSFGQNFERFKGTYGDANYVQRAAQARTIYNESVNGTTAPPNSAAADTTGTGCSGTGSADISAYKDPYRDITERQTSRIDGGLDFGGKGPIYAIGTGKVTYLCNAPFTDYENDAACGWYGPRITYQLSDGPAAHKYVYFAEHCKIRPGLKVGSPVNSSTVICDMQGPDSTNTESGWSNSNGWDYVEGSDYRANKDGDGNYTSNSGQNFADLIKKLGGPSGNPTGGVSHTPLPGFPTWK